MNYRHAYHAGSAADVFKHALLVLQLAHLAQKPSGFLALDTHAGAGLYDLRAAEAEKTGDWRHGIGRVLAEASPHPALGGYLGLLRRWNPAPGAILRYPGSPLLLAACLRPQDRLIAAELQPDEAASLTHWLATYPRARVLAADGYAVLKASLPPPERRGLVLLDPPFETADEPTRWVAALRAAHRRFAIGSYFLWYPIKARADADRLLAAVKASGIRRIYVAELLPFAEARPFRLNGSGLVMVNPGHGLLASLADLLPWLARVLAREGAGGFRAEWLVRE